MAIPMVALRKEREKELMTTEVLHVLGGVLVLRQHQPNKTALERAVPTEARQKESEKRKLIHRRSMA